MFSMVIDHELLWFNSKHPCVFAIFDWHRPLFLVIVVLQVQCVQWFVMLVFCQVPLGRGSERRLCHQCFAVGGGETNVLEGGSDDPLVSCPKRSVLSIPYQVAAFPPTRLMSRHWSWRPWMRRQAIGSKHLENHLLQHKCFWRFEIRFPTIWCSLLISQLGIQLLQVSLGCLVTATSAAVFWEAAVQLFAELRPRRLLATQVTRNAATTAAQQGSKQLDGPLEWDLRWRWGWKGSDEMMWWCWYSEIFLAHILSCPRWQWALHTSSSARLSACGASGGAKGSAWFLFALMSQQGRVRNPCRIL